MEMQMTEASLSPYMGIFLFGTWFVMMYLLRRGMNLQSKSSRRCYGLLCVISLLFVAILFATRWPRGISPLEPDFWMRVQLPFKSWVENWQSTLKTVLEACAWGLFAVFLTRIAHRKS